MDAIIGVSGPPLSGKNTVAERLVEKHGFIHLAFSDALYPEVAAAFGVSEEFLRDPRTKQQPNPALGLRHCLNAGFVLRMIAGNYVTEAAWWSMSPRTVLQLWGTEYRRGADPWYWVNKTEERIFEIARETFGPLRIVIDGVRFENEERLVRRWPYARVAAIWHTSRPGTAFSAAHRADSGLVTFDPKTDVTVYNHEGINELHKDIDALCKSILG